MATSKKLKEQMGLFYDLSFSDQPDKVFSFLKLDKQLSYSDIASYKTINLESFENILNFLFLADIKEVVNKFDPKSILNLSKTSFYVFTNIVALIYVFEFLFKNIINKNAYIQYSSIQQIIFQSNKNKNKNTLYDYNSETHTLNIYMNIDNSFTYKKNSNDNKLLIKPYLDYILSFNQYNYIEKISSAALIFSLLLSYIDFYTQLKKYFETGEEFKSGNLLISKYIKELKASNLIYDNNINLKGYCQETCPLHFILYSDYDNNDTVENTCIINNKKDNKIEKLKVKLFQTQEDVDIKNDYIVVIDNKEYNILEYESESSLLKINAISLNDKSCRSYSDKMSSLDISKNASIDIILKRNQTHLSEYQKIGKKLQNLNNTLYKYKSKINDSVLKNNTQKDIIKSIDLRSYIYYVIFTIIILTYLMMTLMDIDVNKKTYMSIGLFSIVGILNVVNYFMNNSYIENFELQQINSIFKKSDDKIQNMVQIKNIYDEIIIDFLKFQEIHNKINVVNETNSVILNSLKDEVRIYEDKKNTFNYKLKQNHDAIDIMKHETVQKTGFINFLSITVLIIAILVMIYILTNSKYIYTYLVLFIVFEVLNAYKYYYSILLPVRVKARNKYWYKLSNNVESTIS